MKHTGLLLFAFLLSLSCETPPAAQKNNASEADTLTEGSVYTLHDPPLIGEFEGLRFYEGGFSGLHYVPGTRYDFIMVNDRGPNLVVKDSLRKDGHIKLFPFPLYAQKLIRVSARHDTLYVVQTDTLRSPFGLLSGLPWPERLKNDQQEIAWKNRQGEIVPPHPWGLDAEGLAFENDSVFWIAEEYRPSLWKFNARTGRVLAVISPGKSYNSPFSLPSELLHRDANRGFESICLTPSGKIITLLQSPIKSFENETRLKTRLSRLLVFDPRTGVSTQYVYEMNDSLPGKKADWKIGDIATVNEHQLLVLEHARVNGQLQATVYLADLLDAGTIPAETGKASLRIEQAYDALALLQQHGIKAVRKRPLLNLSKSNYPKDIDKTEGLAILNDSTIAILNDNDYNIVQLGASSGNKAKQLSKTRIAVFPLREKLNLKRQAGTLPDPADHR